MASIDLKDSFYSVLVAANHQKYLKLFANQYLKFMCMSNGYGPAMRIFTKITKVQFSVLRIQGRTSVVHLDNSCLQGESYESCLKNVNDTVNNAVIFRFCFNLDSLHARLDNHQEAWSYKEKKHKKIKAYRSVQKEPTVKRCLPILDLKHLDRKSKESILQAENFQSLAVREKKLLKQTSL